MADPEREARLDRIKRDIEEIAQRPKAVQFDELERIVRQLGKAGYDIRSEARKDSHLLGVGLERVTICKHNPGRKELKPVYVREFLKMMRALELLDDQED